MSDKGEDFPEDKDSLISYMNSPIYYLKNTIAQCIFRVAPEKAENLNEILDDKGINFEFSSLKRKSLVSAYANGEIFVQTRFLELLWCSSYLYVVFYNLYSELSNQGIYIIDSSQHPKLADAIDLYRWSLENVHNVKNTNDWPELNIKPENELNNIDIKAANEFFLCALSWVFLHEIAHIHLEHNFSEVVISEDMNEEREADEFATNWLLDNIGIEQIDRKLGVSITIANLVLIGLDFKAGTISVQTHPPSYERFYNNLEKCSLPDNDLLRAFQLSSLQVMTALGNLQIKVSDDESFFENVCDSLHQINKKFKN